MRAEEEQRQGVVGVDGLLVAADVGSRDLLSTLPRMSAAQLVDDPAGCHGDQPAVRALGDAFLGPLNCGCEQRLLDRVLADVEPAISADERAEDPRRRPAQQVLELGRLRHRSSPDMCMIGRTSTAKCRAEGSLSTISVARSMLSHSSR